MKYHDDLKSNRKTKIIKQKW